MKKNFSILFLVLCLFSCQELVDQLENGQETDQESGPSLVTLSLSCSESESSNCDPELLDGKPVSGGLFQGATCAQLLSGSDDGNFVYNLSEGDTGQYAQYVMCDDSSCSLETDSWYSKEEVEGEEDIIREVEEMEPGTYSFAVMIDSDPLDGSDGPTSGDMLFCIDDVLNIGELDGEITLNIDDSHGAQLNIP